MPSGESSGLSGESDMRQGLQILHPETGEMIYDFSSRVVALSFETGEHGFRSLSASLRIPKRVAHDLYTRRTLADVYLGSGAETVWEGRLEDVVVTMDGASISALGASRALYDTPMTALFTSEGIGPWSVASEDGLSDARPQSFGLSAGDHTLYLQPRKGVQYDDSFFGAWWMHAPTNSSRQIDFIEFYYTLTAASPWRAEVWRVDESHTAVELVWSLTGDSGTQSGTVQLTPDDCHGLAFALRYNSGTAAEYSDEPGETVLSVSSIYVTTFGVKDVTGYDIMCAITEYVSGINPQQLNPCLLGIDDPGEPIRSFWLEDVLPMEAVNAILQAGDDQEPPRYWRAGVWDGKRMHFEPITDSRRDWDVDVHNPELERSLELMYTAVYATYAGTDTGVQRTDLAVDESAESIVGVRRVLHVDTTAESLASAERERDAALDQSFRGRVRSSMRVYVANMRAGGRQALYNMRAGDSMSVRNMPPGYDRDFFEFQISSTRFVDGSDFIEVTPLEPPTVAKLISEVSR